MIKDVATQLINQFAAALHQQILADKVAPAASEAAAGAPAAQAAPPPPAAKPISGFSLGLKVLWNAIRRLFGAKD